MKKCIRNLAKISGWNALRTMGPAAAAAILAVSGFAGSALAGTLYWDTDGSTAGNSAATGAALGGAGIWSTGVANWWDPGLGTPQVWTDRSDAVFWGTAGAVTASTISANSLSFRTSGYSINSGTLTMTGVPSNFNVDTGVVATISSTIAGTNTLWKLGAGTLILANTNNLNTASTVAGGWRLEGGGTLRISGDGCLGAPLPDSARNTITDIQLNQSTLQAGASFTLSQNRRTKINTNVSTNRDAIIDVNGNVLTWFGSLQGGAGSLRVISGNDNGGMLILGTDKTASINPFGSVLPAGTVNLTVQDRVVVQTSGQVTPTGGELGSETNTSGAVLAIRLEGGGQIRSESGGYTFYRNLILGPGGGSLDVGAWIQTFAGGTISGPGSLTKFGRDYLVLDNPSATWAGGTFIREGTLQLGRSGSNGLLPGTLASPSSVVISAGATLRFNRGSSKSFFDIISGAGGITVANTPTAIVRLVSDNTYTGPTTISSGTLMIGQGNPGDPGSIVSSLVNNSASLVFNRVEDSSYSGAINGSGTVTKQGAGRLVLSGTHTYTGATTVSAGTLLVSGVIGASAVTVNGGTLGGNGLFKGPVTVQPGGRLSPGPALSRLTISNALNLSGITVMKLSAATHTNDLLRGLTTVTYGGTLLLSNLAGTVTATDSFKLFDATIYRGAFAALSPATPAPGLAWNTNTLATDGTLRIVSTAAVTMTSALSSDRLNLSWPVDHTGWRLQVQTNSLAVGLGSNWLNVPGSIATNQMSFTIDPNEGCVFYRLVYP